MQTLASKSRHYGHRKISVSLMQDATDRIFIDAGIDTATLVRVAMPSWEKAAKESPSCD